MVRRRRGLPAGRAVMGGFLVVVAAVGTFGAWTAANAGPETSYVVVTADVAPGDPVAPDDLAVVALDLPDAQRSLAFTAPAELTDAVALGHLAAGQLVQTSDVARDQGGADTVQLSFSVAAADALFGDVVRSGEHVDLVAVYGTGEDATAATIATDALVVASRQADRGLGGQGDVTFVVAVRTDEVVPVAKATSAGRVKVVRTTGRAG